MKLKLLKFSNAALLLTSFLFVSACKNDKKNENEKENEKDKMEMKADTSKPKENPYKNAQLDIKVFKNDTVKDSQVKGFGYDIYMYRSLYVHQPHIPAINGNRGFDTEEQAHKTAEFIVYKIKNNIMPPSVTPAELDSLGVLK
jgi:hypothetical protein